MQPSKPMETRRPDRVLGLFAKWPAVGTVKTRLATGRDPAWGVRVARAFLLNALGRLAAVDAHRVLAFHRRTRSGVRRCHCWPLRTDAAE